MRWSISADLTAAGPQQGAFDRVCPQFEITAQSHEEALAKAAEIVRFALPGNWQVLASSIAAVPIEEFVEDIGSRLVREGPHALTYALLRGCHAGMARVFAQRAAFYWPNMTISAAYAAWLNED